MTLIFVKLKKKPNQHIRDSQPNGLLGSGDQQEEGGWLQSFKRVYLKSLFLGPWSSLNSSASPATTRWAPLLYWAFLSWEAFLHRPINHRTSLCALKFLTVVQNKYFLLADYLLCWTQIICVYDNTCACMWSSRDGGEGGSWLSQLTT